MMVWFNQIKSQMFMIIVGIFWIYVCPSDLVGITKKGRLRLTSNSKMHNTKKMQEVLAK